MAALTAALLLCLPAAAAIRRADAAAQQLAPGSSLSLLNSNGIFRSSTLSKPLGLASGAVPDERFSASSVYRSPGALYQPWLGRAHAVHAAPTRGYWRPAESKAGEFVTVDLGRDYIVTAVALQGAPDESGWVTRAHLQTSREGASWKSYPVPLRGNADGATVVVNDLHEPATARYVRVVVDEWEHAAALRFEVYGYTAECSAAEEERVVGVPCAQSGTAAAAARRGDGEGEAVVVGSAPDRLYGKGFPLGIEAGIIPDGAFSASSTFVAAKPVREDEGCAALNAEAAAHAMRFAQADMGGGAPVVTIAHADTNTNTDAVSDAKARAALTAARFAGAGTEAAARPVQPTDGKGDCNVYYSYAAHFARLNQQPQPYKSGGWKPADDTAGEYLQVDLGSLQEVDAVATQGRDNSFDWVTAFALDYSMNGRQWDTLPIEFAANSDSITLVKHVLPHPILARHIRFVVRGFNTANGGGIGLRVEAYGPGKGQGCMLRCHATKLAVDAGIRDIDAVVAMANGGGDEQSFLEVSTLSGLTAELGVDATSVISCCGCSCCGVILPGSCGAKRPSAATSLDVVKSIGGGEAVPIHDQHGGSGVTAESVRVLLRGHAKEGGEAPAFGGPAARTAVAAKDEQVAATVVVPGAPTGSKTFFVVQRDE